MPLRQFLIAALCAAAMPAGADVYRWVDADGNVIFSDTPQEGAETVEIGETTVVPALKPPPPKPAPVADPDKAVPYESVVVSEPPNEATLRNTQGVTVRIAVAPALQTRHGHRLQLYVDGSPFGAAGTATSFVLPEVYRGSHQLQAAVLDAEGKELRRSEVSVFYLHQTSVQHPSPAGTSAP